MTEQPVARLNEPDGIAGGYRPPDDFARSSKPCNYVQNGPTSMSTITDFDGDLACGDRV